MLISLVKIIPLLETIFSKDMKYHTRNKVRSINMPNIRIHKEVLDTAFCVSLEVKSEPFANQSE